MNVNKKCCKLFFQKFIRLNHLFFISNIFYGKLTIRCCLFSYLLILFCFAQKKSINFKAAKIYYSAQYALKVLKNVKLNNFFYLLLDKEQDYKLFEK